MKTQSKGLAARVAAAVALAMALSQALPTFALAAGVSGADILIPKPAEFIPALIAFLVIWIILAKFAWPSILNTLDARQQKIQDDLDAAAQSREEAKQEQERYAAQLAEAENEADEIVQQAKRDAEAERGRIMAKAQKDAASTIAKSRDAIESERRKAMIELSGSVVDLSVEIASKIIGNDLSEDNQRKLAEKYLSEVSSEVGNDNEPEA